MEKYEICMKKRLENKKDKTTVLTSIFSRDDPENIQVQLLVQRRSLKAAKQRRPPY